MLNRASCGRGAVSHPQTLKAGEGRRLKRWPRWLSWSRDGESPLGGGPAGYRQLMGMPDPGGAAPRVFCPCFCSRLHSALTDGGSAAAWRWSPHYEFGLLNAFVWGNYFYLKKGFTPKLGPTYCKLLQQSHLFLGFGGYF